MATYFHGNQEMHSNGLQTLLLMNPAGYASPYPVDASTPTGLGILNGTINQLDPLNHATISQENRHNQHQTNPHLVGVPLPTMASFHGQHDIGSGLAVHGMSPHVLYNTSTMQHSLSLGLNYSMYRPDAAVEMQRAIARESAGEAASNSIQGLPGVVMGSKYLKVTQKLLEEVVNVGKALDKGCSWKSPKKSYEEVDGGDIDSGNHRPVVELTTGERQELQMKKAKLVHLLDEVEQRYRQYDHQMQAVIASFESVAGVRTARPYTSLALRTISKQFRCLRDAICNRIRAASWSLGEEECLQSSTPGGLSRLKYMDHHLRQQRPLQQLGMPQHNAWRPQRGLPERSVSVLRAWLFEHFLHPYPKDSDKILLAKQTGLTRNQVSNWFINARVRLWKPMVEEMYMEEMKGQKLSDTASGSPSNACQKDEEPPLNSQPPPLEKNYSIRMNINDHHSEGEPSPPPIIHTQPQYEDIIQPNLKKARGTAIMNITAALPLTLETELKPEETNHSDLFMGFQDSAYNNLNLLTSATYPMEEIGRYTTNGVSLTLGPSYLNESYIFGRRFGMGSDPNEYCSNLNDSSSSCPTVPHPQSAYDSLGIQNRKSFEVQLLPDFVA